MVLFTGKTVEEAIEKGLKELQLSRLKAHIKVISREKRGFLGFGKKLAQVEIDGISEATAHKADQKAVKGVPEQINDMNEPVSSKEEDTLALKEAAQLIKEQEKQGNTIDDSVKDSLLNAQKSPQTILEESKELVTATETSQSFEAFVASEFSEEETTETIEEATEAVYHYIQTIIYEMDIEATIASSHTRRQINLQIETPEAGRVIGYHGKVLKSMQLLAQNLLHDRYSKNFSVVLNVHDYVEHRTEILVEFTRKAAKRVLETGKDFVMDPMSNSERKIVHKTITGLEGVQSYSEGNDPNRYVVVTSAR